MSTLSDLAADLGVSPDSLRESLTSEIGEALQPSYLSVNPDGSLGALSFSGRTAQGGRNTVHWSGGQLSDQLVVPHVLGVVPTAVVCTTVDPSNSGITVQTQVDFEVQNLTSTTFSVRATQPSSGILVNLDFYWVAISGDKNLTVNFATGDVATAANGPGVSAHKSADQAIPAGGAVTKITFDTVDEDPQNLFANGALTVTGATAGFWHFGGLLSLQAAGVGTGAPWIVRLHKNGVRYRDLYTYSGSSVNAGGNSSVLDRAVAGDVYELYAVNLDNVARSVFSSPNGTRFEAIRFTP